MSLPSTACAHNAASTSGAVLPSAASGSRSRSASGPAAKCRPDASCATPPPFHRIASVVAAISSSAWAKTPSTHRRTLASGSGFLAHLMRQVADQPIGTVLEQRRHQRVLGGEVPVERVVGQPSRGHDVGDPRPGRRPAPVHDLASRRREAAGPRSRTRLRACRASAARSAGQWRPRLPDLPPDLCSAHPESYSSRNGR